MRQLLLADPEKQVPLEENRMTGPPLSVEECTKLITDFINAQDSVTIVIDSIDNSLPADSRPPSFSYVNLLTTLMFIMQRVIRPVKLLISSQAQDDRIERVLKERKHTHQYQISADDQPSVDIERLIKYQVMGWDSAEFLVAESNKEMLSRVKRDVIKTLIRRSGRM